MTVWDKNKASGDEYPFYVRADGRLHCVYGDIGGWNISSEKLTNNISIEMDDGTYSGEFYLSPNEGVVLNCSNDCSDWLKKTFGLNGIVIEYGDKEETYSETLLDNYLSIREGYYNSYLTGDIFALEYNDNKSQKMFRIRMRKDVSGVDVDGNLYFSNSLMLTPDNYVFSKNKSGNTQSLVGLSGNNNIWLGDYGYSGNPKRQIASAAYIVANNIYKASSSGNTSLSDERYKYDFKDIGNALDFIMNLNPCLFKFNDGTSGRYHMGFKAQEVEKDMLNTIGDTGLTVKYNCEDELQVDLNNPDTYILGLRYEEFIAPLIQVVQEQQSRINELENSYL